ncbi:uncharacterized protein LOC127283960 [Leptopilina boulardi]|uniref:uncharacterized protein LOC127283960 n=1 Tax=Leptopilina boulardi TaxID=63433 RepID=UPI0021F50D43|nr:uncharacterized protein LOC127283960 [Leptopilina boulardi]
MPRQHSTSVFQEQWLTDPLFINWLKKSAKDGQYAYCFLCLKDISVYNMGRQSLLSHMKSKKHKEKLLVMQKTVDIRAQLSSPKSTSENYIPEPIPQANDSEKSFQEPVVTKKAEVRGIKAHLLKENVTTAEIILCLQSVITHKSMRTAAKDVSLFKMIFSDSEIAQKLQLQRTKIGYTIVFGIAPYFKEELIKVLLNCPRFVIGFDESLNKVCQQQQMDINVRYWDDQTNQVCTRYLTSAFLGSTKAVDLLKAFLEALKPLNVQLILQISMDGPNVNLKFLKDLKVYLKNCECDTVLLELGSCGIHTCHNGFKAGFSATDWDIVKFLRGLYNVFKDVPSRRALYTCYTNSSIFPMKFCSIRWLENADVAQRALDMLPHVQTFIKTAENEKTQPSSASYKKVTECMQDPMIGPKLAFFKTIATDVEPFLREFQSDWPLAPFLYSALHALLEKIMDRFVKPSCIRPDVDVYKQENLIHSQKIEIGFESLKEIKKCRKRVTDLEIAVFRRDCRRILQKFVSKINERSPLKFKLTEAISSLDPVIFLKPEGKERFQKLLHILHDNNWIHSATADTALHQYKELCSSMTVIEECKIFNRKKERLDSFWMRHVLNNDREYHDFKIVLETTLILSHGNANIERGFSINAESIFENMTQETLVANRIIYDAVNALGGINKVPITKSLIHAARNANKLYKEALQRKKKTSDDESQELLKLKENSFLIKNLESEKSKVLKDAEKAAQVLDKKIEVIKSK